MQKTDNIKRVKTLEEKLAIIHRLQRRQYRRGQNNETTNSKQRSILKLIQEAESKK